MDRLELFVLTATESALKKSMAHFGCRQVVSPRFLCRIFVGFLGEIIFSMFDIHSDFCMGRSLVAFWKHDMKCWPFFFPGSLCVFSFFPCHEIPRDPMKGSWDPPFDSAWVVRSSTAKWTHESGIVENENLPVEGWEIPNTLGCWDCWDGMVGCGLEKASISWRRLGVIFIILMLRFIHLFSCIYLQYITLHGRLLPHKIHKSQDIVLRWNAFTLRTKHRCMNEINAKLSHSRNGESLTSQLAGNRIVASHNCRTKKAWKN